MKTRIAQEFSIFWLEFPARSERSSVLRNWKIKLQKTEKHKLRTTFSLGLGLVKTKRAPDKSRTKSGRDSEEDAIQMLRRDL